MLNSERILQALNGADDELIEEARRCMGYGAPARSRRAHRMGWRVALIAAVLAALFAVTAYAMDWFGLSSRLTRADPPLPAETERQGGYMSMNGYAGTPEGQAHAEWSQFWNSYTENKTFSNAPDLKWLGEDQRLKNYHDIYGAFDRTMMDKLLEIRDRYKVKLHSESAGVPNAEYFYKATGLSPFIRGEHELWPELIYEEGSFSLEGSLDGMFFSVHRGARGYLDPSPTYIYDSDEYEEWQYTTASGELLNLAAGNAGEEQTVFVFYQDGNYLITISANVSGGEDYQTKAEAFAERFDYTALCTGTVDLSVVLNSEPTRGTAREGLLTLRDWVETDEYQAATEFQKFYTAYAATLPEGKGHVKGFPHFYYYGAFPSGIAEVDEEYGRIAEEYGLKMPEEASLVWGGRKIPSSDMLQCTGGLKLTEGKEQLERFPELSMEDIYELTGSGPFLFDGDPGYYVIAYDNGAFAYVGSMAWVHYIPKGCFYPLLRDCLHPDREGWAYDTACGEQVYITAGGEMEYPVTDYSSIVYETYMAYVIIVIDGESEAYQLEDVADSIDFTAFP